MCITEITGESVGTTKVSLRSAMTICKGKKGCEFAHCMKDEFGKAPKWSKDKCQI